MTWQGVSSFASLGHLKNETRRSLVLRSDEGDDESLELFEQANRVEVFGWIFVRNAVIAVNEKIFHRISPQSLQKLAAKFTASTFVAN